MPKSKLSAFISLMLVFLSGTLVGALGHRLYMVNTARPRLSPEEVQKHQLAELKQKVGLDDQQAAQYNAILDSTRQQFNQLHDKWNAEGRSIRDQQVEKVKAILHPDQVPLYDRWRAEREAERKRREQERNKK